MKSIHATTCAKATTDAHTFLLKIYTVSPESNRRTHESHQHKRFQASDVFGATTKNVFHALKIEEHQQLR